LQPLEGIVGMGITTATTVRMANISKSFGPVEVLHDAQLSVAEGEIVGLVGENGAGKSTLCKILAGVWPFGSYEGVVKVGSTVLRSKSVIDAEAQGVFAVHQDPATVPSLSVAENMFLTMMPTNRLGLIDFNALHDEARQWLDILSIQVDPSTPMVDLSFGQRQLVSIVTALSRNPKVLILDEATSGLTTNEISRVFDAVKSWANKGVSTIFISHKLEEVRELCDRVVVLRDGTVVGEGSADEVTEDQIVAWMIGRNIGDFFPKEFAEAGETVCEVKGWNVPDPDHPGRNLVDDVSFGVRKGEIVGIYGLVGAGRTELLMSLFGSNEYKGSGTIVVDGETVRDVSPRSSIDRGVVLVTEDRKETGLVLGLSVKENMTLPWPRIISHLLGQIDFERETDLCTEYVSRFSIRTPSLEFPAGQLSGGNQQKVVIGKWLFGKPKVVLLDEPTRGVDVGAKVEIYRLLNEIVASGIAVVMVSSELPEVQAMSDRILVMRNGRMVAEFEREATERDIILAATGIGANETAASRTTLTMTEVV
jgi:D-xylose transport system ATP-binding protein